MTPRERSKKTLAKFKQAAFDPDAVSLIEDMFTLTIEAAIAERQEANIAIIRQYLQFNSERAVSWHEVNDAIDAIRRQGQS